MGDRTEGTLVALKLVHPALAHDGEFRERFRREVAAGRRLTGPFVAAVLAADPPPAGTLRCTPAAVPARLR